MTDLTLLLSQIDPDEEPQIEAVMRGLAVDALRVINHDHGTHVIQRFQKRFSLAQNDFVHAIAKHHCVKLAMSANGVAVLILCIDGGSRKLRVSGVSASGVLCCSAAARAPLDAR
jgi:hypothetical protein